MCCNVIRHDQCPDFENKVAIKKYKGAFPIEIFNPTEQNNCGKGIFIRANGDGVSTVSSGGGGHNHTHTQTHTLGRGWQRRPEKRKSKHCYLRIVRFDLYFFHALLVDKFPNFIFFFLFP